MVLSGIYVGGGDFGKKLGLDLFKRVLDFPSIAERIHSIYVADLYPQERFLDEIVKRGLSSIAFQNARVILEIFRTTTQLRYHWIKRSSEGGQDELSQAGVGKFWAVALKYGIADFERFFGRIKDETMNFEGMSLFIFASSAGGGTGCGVIPYWATRFREKVFEEKIFSDPLNMVNFVFTVLPFRYQWGGISEPNSASYIGRVWKGVKAIFLADNETFLRKYKISEVDVERIVNEKVVESILALYTPSASSRITTSLEAADYNKMFGHGERASIIVPATGYFKIEHLKRWGVRTLVGSIITSNLLIDIDAEKKIRKVFTFITLPDNYIASTSDFYKLNDFIYELLDVEEYPSQPFIFYNKDLRGYVKIDIFLVDPYVPRLKDLYLIYRETIENRKRLRIYIESMIATTNIRSITEDELREYESAIENSFNEYEDFLNTYLADWGENVYEISALETSYSQLPLPLTSLLQKEETFRKPTKTFRVHYVTKDYKWSGEVEDHISKTMRDTLFNLLKYLSQDTQLNNPELTNSYDFQIDVDGVSLPLTESVLDLSLEEYPEFKTLHIFPKRKLERIVVCPYCNRHFKVVGDVF